MSHADHEWARELLPAHLAGGLSVEERTRLEAHVAGCAECIAEIDALRRFEREMEETFVTIRPEPGLEERVIRQLRTFPFQKERPRALKIASGLAAVFLMGFVGFAVLNVAEEGSPTPRVVEGIVHPKSAAMAGYAAHPTSPSTVAARPEVRRGEVAPETAEYRLNAMLPSPEGGERLRSAGEMARLEVERARDVFGRGIPKDDQAVLSTEEPAIFLPEARAPREERLLKKNPESTSILLSVPRDAAGADRQAGRQEFDAPRGPEEKPRVESKKPSSGPMAPPAEGFYSYDGFPAVSKPSPKSAADEGAFKPGLLAKLEKNQLDKEEEKKVVQEANGSGISTGGLALHSKKTQEGAPQLPQPQAPARKIIRTGEMEFEIESFDGAVAKIDTIALEEQGLIATVNSEKLPNGKVRGTVVVRVPPDNLGRLVAKLRALGDLKSQKLGSEDVTKSYYDLESRLRAARTMEERLLKIIKEGKGEIKDLLQAERELGEWRTKIEQFEGEKRYYDNLISLSTLTITLFEKEIRAAFGVTETERVDAGVETEDVEKAYKDLQDAVLQAKGRILKSDLKKLAAGQFTATVNFEVAPDAAGGLRDRLKQLGSVARLDVNLAQQTEGGRTPPPDIKVKRSDSQFFVSIYNLANVDPRLTVHLNLACVDAEKAYKSVLERVEKAGGRVRTSNLNRQKSDQTNGSVDFQVKEAEAEAVLLDLRALGETMYLQITENSDLANVTRSKRGFVVALAALGTVQPRETATIQFAAKDVAVAYSELSEAVRKAEGRMLVANLNESDRRNVTATLSFDVRRDAMKGVEDVLKASGEVYSRTSNRLQDAQNVVDSKIKFDFTLFSIENLAPRESIRLALEVNDVDAATGALEAIVREFKGKVRDPYQASDPGGQKVSHSLVDVPLKDLRAIEARVRGLGRVRVTSSKRDPTVPESDLAIGRLDVTLSNEVIVAPDSAPWASIKKGFSVSVLALSWSLTLIMIGLCFVLPIAAIGWGGWKLAKSAKKKSTPAA